MLYKWLSSTPSLVYPPTCLLCQGSGSGKLDLCRACAADLPRITQACQRCGLCMETVSVDLCGSCQRHPPHFDAVLAPFHYAPPVDHMIKRLKFQGKLVYARLLGNLLADAVEASRAGFPEWLIPVPLHTQRLRERGFNQANEIARHLGKRLGIRVMRRQITRPRATRPQMELPAKARRGNIRNAFEVSSALNASHVAIVDDVMTTGSTVNELARILVRAGVERVQVWNCARAS